MNHVGAATQLPIWAMWLIFAATCSWTIFQFFASLQKLLTPAKLQASLTKGTFWRLLDSGETFYIRVVALAANGLCKIEGISVSLIYASNAAKKEYVAEFRALAEILPDAGNPFGTLHFISTSPIHFVGPDFLSRNVLVCGIADNESDIQAEWRSIREFIAIQKGEYASIDPTTVPEDERQRIFKEITDRFDSAAGAIRRKIQVAPGKYSLSINITYRGKIGSVWSKPKLATSALEFEIEADFDKHVNSMLKQILMDDLLGASAATRNTSTCDYGLLKERVLTEEESLALRSSTKEKKRK